MSGQKILDGLGMAVEHARMTAELATARAEIADLRAQVARLSTVTEEDAIDFYRDMKAARQPGHKMVSAQTIMAALSAFVARASAKAG